MAHEIEAKILEVDVPALEARLASIGATKVAEYFFRIRNWDFPGYPLKADGSWVRLRTDGEHTTLAFKKKLGIREGTERDAHMEEIETDVGDFDTAALILSRIGMLEKHSQEKKRVSWKKGSITYDIDTWPLLPTFLEVEGEDWGEVQHAVEELGYDWENRLVCDASKVYAHYGIEWDEYRKIGFESQVKKEAGDR